MSRTNREFQRALECLLAAHEVSEAVVIFTDPKTGQTQVVCPDTTSPDEVRELLGLAAQRNPCEC